MKTRERQMTPAAIAALAKGDIKNFIAASTPGGIEAQEKAGQIEQSFAETLPIEGTSGESRKQWEALGFVFGEPEDIFVNVKFPKDWRKQPTDHDMWSNLLDDKGRKRASIFYKAAFYDRSAHINLTTRFSYTCYEAASNETYTVVVKDDGKIVETFGTWSMGDARVVREAAEIAATKWLTERYPKWQDASAYWD